MTQNESLLRWLRHLGACYGARLKFRTARTFDEAWGDLDDGVWIWWLGQKILNLDDTWEYRYHTESTRVTFLIDHPVLKRRMKRAIYKQVKAHYQSFSRRRAR